MRKIIAVTLSILMLFSMVATAQPTTTANLVKNDIEGHWAYETMTQWIEKGLVKGYTDGSYRPDGNITKAEFITLINRILGYYVEGDENYDDIEDDDWYRVQTSIAKNNHYMDWHTQEDLMPNQKITREEVSAILACITNISASEDMAAIDGFNDKDAISEWSTEYIDAVVNKGYMKGYEDNTLRPTGQITRAEAITMIDRVVGVLIDEEGTYGPEEESETIDNNVTITAENVVLQNTVIRGDLILAAGIKDGDVDLVNVTVEGRTIINGGGQNSVTFTNCDLGDVIVLRIGGTVRVVSANSDIAKMILRSGCRLEGDFEEVEIMTLKPGESVELEGNYEDVTIQAEVEMSLDDKSHIDLLTIAEGGSGSQIDLEASSSIDKIVFEGAADVTGDGSIEKAIVKADGATTEQEVGDKNVFPGIDGSGVKEESRSSGSSSSSSDSTDPVPGNSGLLATSSVSADSVILSWTKATDNKSEQVDLEYLAYYSTSDNIDTVENAEANGMAIGIIQASYSADIDSMYIEGLDEETIYYFNIIVKDEKGNKAAYSSIDETTADLGSGTEVDPYKVAYIEDLTKIGTGDWRLDKSYILINDLDFNDDGSYKTGSVDTANTTGAGFTPIGYNVDYFTGSFDGNDNEIANLYINTSEMYAGLFSTTSDAAISDLGLVNNDVTGDNRTGSLAGYMNNSTVSNCYATGIVSGRYMTGGMIGESENTAVSGCNTAMSVTGTSSYAGGLIGDSKYSTTMDSYTSGNISSGSTSVGGLIGSIYNASVKNCHSTADVSGFSKVGGLVAYSQNYSLIEDSYATGDVTADDGNAGGLVGGNYNGSKIIHCYASGDIAGNAVNSSGYVGGLAGINLGSDSTIIQNSYASGNVSGKYSVGGLSGGNGGGAIIKNCYSTGDVTGSETQIGALTGHNYNTSRIEKCYASGKVTGDSKVSGLVGYDSGIASMYGNISFSFEVTGNSDVGRIAGATDRSSISNCYAYDGMVITETGSSYYTGMDISSLKNTTVAPLNTWESDWNNGTNWEIKSGADRPTLIGVGDDQGNLPEMEANGSEKYPFKVETIEDLAKIGTGTDEWGLDKHYILMNDLDFKDKTSYESGEVDNSLISGEGWEPIGEYDEYYGQSHSDYFTGSLDGNGYTISNLFINRPEYRTGLISIGSGCEIRDLGIIDAEIISDGNAGILAGNIVNDYNLDKYPVIENCYTTGSIVSDPGGTSGGLVGSFSAGLILNSYSQADLHTKYTQTGGLVGRLSSAQVINCYSTGSIEAGYGGVSEGYAGGLFGYSSNSNILNSYTTSSILRLTSYTSRAGGIVGYGGTSKIINTIAFNEKVNGDFVNNEIAGSLAIGSGGMMSYTYSRSDLITNYHHYDGIDISYSQFKADGSDSDFYTDSANWDSTSSFTAQEGTTYTASMWDFTDDADGEGYWKIKNDRPVLYIGDGDGNTSNDQQLGSDNGLVTESTPPIPGDSASTTVEAITMDSVTLNWTKATDNKTAQADLEYRAYYSTSNDIDTVENAETNGTAAGTGYTSDVDALTVSGLNDDTTYYFNVIVRDESGNKSIYNTVTCKTAMDIGSGTSGDPYKIRYIEDLAKVGTGTDGWDLNDHYILMNNLDFESPGSYKSGVVDTTYTTGEGWMPLARSGNFTGTLDGDGYVIANLFINRPAYTGVGLIAFTEQAEIKNLGIVDCNVMGKERVGSLVGYLYDSDVTDCYATGIVSGNLIDSYYLGGLIGWCYDSSISKSYSECEVTGYGYVGGLVGYNHYQSTVENCYTSGNVFGDYSLGGIAGEVHGSTLAYSYSKGNVIGTGTVVNDFVGGLAGFVHPDATVVNSIAFNNFATIPGANIGRIAGNPTGIYANNFGHFFMLLNGVPVTTVDQNSKDGADLMPIQFTDISFYTNELNWIDTDNADGDNDVTTGRDPWDFTDVWEIKPGADSPTLK